MPDYKSKISVLHVEDDKKTLKELASELIKRNIYVHSVTNFKDAIDAIRKCYIDVLVCDGMFPDVKGRKERKNFIPLVERIKKLKKWMDIVAWSNSTHVHEYCRKNKIESYSKETIAKERFKSKGRKYIKVKNLGVCEMADIVEKKILGETGLDKIKNTRFEEYYTEPATVLGMFMAVDMRTAMFKKTAGMNYGPWLTEIENKLCTVYADKSNDAIVSNSIYQKIIKHNFFPEIDRNVSARAKKLLYFSRSLKSMNYSRHSNKGLQALYLKFCRLFMEMRMYSSLPTAMEHGTSSWTYLLKNILKNKINDEQELNRVFSILTTPRKLSYMKEFELETAKIGIKKHQGKNVKTEVKRLAEKYAWVNYTFEGIPIDKRYILDRLADLGKTKCDFEALIKENKARQKDVEKEKQNIIKKYEFSEKEKTLFEIGADIVFIKFFRKGVFAESYYSVEFLLEEIGKRIGCTRKQTVNMLPYEVLAALELGSFPCNLIDNRIKKSSMLHYAGHSYALPKSAESIYKKSIRISASKETNELNGQTAFPGKVSGKVKIINVIKDMEKFDQGDILVSRSTNPTLVPAMKKAAAIVTDLGGLTCHAAIVAREMKKPCIIGTKIATKVFRDGDYVLVDADKGIVKKLTKKQHGEMKKLVLKERQIEHKEEAIIEEKIAEAPKRPDTILWFKDVFKNDLPIVGGKGANLGEMFEHFPIPNGFCITVNAYQQFLKENKLDKKIFPLLSNLDSEDTRKLDNVSKKIENIILKAKMSKAVEKEILANYRKMKNFVAVRSSATAEDLPTASFAGQQATFLNVKGEKEFLDAVKKCWASLFTSRAIYYRNTNSFDHEKVLISVVVQEMVDSEKAGVMFTVNPVTKNPEEMIIEGSFGLGEMVVSGQVTPDSYIVNKKSMKLTMKNIGDKKLAMIRKDGKNIIKNLSEKESNEQVLTEKEVKELALLGKKIEQHYGKPQDIEWAVYKGKIYILQSRPITTL